MTGQDHSHLHALEHGLFNERQRLASARTDHERELRSVWVAQREREVARERRLLGLPDAQEVEAMSDSELLAALLA